MKINKEDSYYKNLKNEIYNSYKENYNDYYLDKKDVIKKLAYEINNYKDTEPSIMKKWAEYLGWDKADDMYDQSGYSKNCKICGVKLHGNTKGDLCKECKIKKEAEDIAVKKAAAEIAKKGNKVLQAAEEMMLEEAFEDPTKKSTANKSKKKTTKKKAEDTMPKAKNNEVEGKSVLYNKHGMIYIDLHKEPEQQHLFAFNKTKMPKGLSIVCKGCNEEIEHYSQQFRSYYCPHCLVIYPDKAFDLDTQGGKQELEQWVELVRPIVPGAKKVKQPKDEQKEKELQEAAENFKHFEETGGNFEDLGDIFEA